MGRGHGMVVLAGLLAIGMTNALAAETQSPAMQAYDRLSAAREQAEAVRKDGKDTPASRQQAEAILLKALGDTYSPEITSLADGSGALRFRSYNIRDDLFLLYVDEGEKAKALDMMAANVAQAPIPADNIFRSDKAKALLKDESRYKDMLSHMDATGRLWHAKTIAVPYKPQLSEAERIAGLSLFWSEAKYNFAHFNNVPQLDWDQAYLDFLPQVIAASDTRSYYEVLMRFAPLLHDGHTNIDPPKELQDSFYARPPLRTALIGGKVLVTFVGSALLDKQGIHAGDEIASIDGVEVKQYAHEHVEPYESSSTPQDMDVRKYTYSLLGGDKDKPVELGLDDGHGHRRTVTVARSNYPDRHGPPQFEFRMLPGGVAYLAIDHFESEASSKAFEDHLPQIMQAKALILDMRQNGGGSDSYGFKILTHLTDAPIPSAAAYEQSVSAVSRANGGLGLEWVPLDGSGEAYPHETKSIFRGPVALLIGAQTFSAGEDFVMSFDTLKRGILVGQPTGGSTGMPMSFMLPGGGWARICVKWDRYPDGREFVGRGITPTIALAPSVADVRAGKDPVLERARRELVKSLP
ncbi:S41 family peptidase [Dyella sp. GSA-30]|uniref:S41 family peptidase n=1 Tax=Dyella sp. GSA-30 TaxID=2994496 RepID=UPI0024915D19|nr:S41 family peptidase [Dyella sp. GSA-30]BDU19771.1 hypothetical protein DYGSA30_12280 [Dyella sp. GSA-30]